MKKLILLTVALAITLSSSIAAIPRANWDKLKADYAKSGNKISVDEAERIKIIDALLAEKNPQPLAKALLTKLSTPAKNQKTISKASADYMVLVTQMLAEDQAIAISPPPPPVDLEIPAIRFDAPPILFGAAVGTPFDYGRVLTADDPETGIKGHARWRYIDRISIIADPKAAETEKLGLPQYYDPADYFEYAYYTMMPGGDLQHTFYRTVNMSDTKHIYRVMRGDRASGQGVECFEGTGPNDYHRIATGGYNQQDPYSMWYQYPENSGIWYEFSWAVANWPADPHNIIWPQIEEVPAK